jgi:hypothetical protein
VSITTVIAIIATIGIVVFTLWRRFHWGWPGAIWRWICANKFELTLLAGIAVMLLGLALGLLGILDLKEQANENREATANVVTTLQEYGDALRTANPQLPIPQIVQPTPEVKKTKEQKEEDGKPKVVVRPPIRPPTPAPTLAPLPSPQVIVKQKTKKVYIRRPTPKPFKWPWQKPSSTR